jgi:hypothetical protein
MAGIMASAVMWAVVFGMPVLRLKGVGTALSCEFLGGRSCAVFSCRDEGLVRSWAQRMNIKARSKP